MMQGSRLKTRGLSERQMLITSGTLTEEAVEAAITILKKRPEHVLKFAREEGCWPEDHEGGRSAGKPEGENLKKEGGGMVKSDGNL
jgi:hypothetical protein